MRDWNSLLEEVEAAPRSPLRPQMVIRALSDLLSEDAVISLDCGANTHFAARCLRRGRADLTSRIIVFGETFVPSLSNAELCGRTAFVPRLFGPCTGYGRKVESVEA